MTTQDPVSVLLVDDSAEDALVVRRALEEYARASFRVVVKSSAREGLEELRSNGADILLLDYAMPGEDGFAFLRRASNECALPPVVLLTGRGDERLAVEAIRRGACDYLAKDRIRPETLGDAVCAAIERFRVDDEAHRYDEQIAFALASAAEGKDFTTGRHLQRLAQYAALIGAELGLGARELRVLRFGGLLHDIGKLAVSAAALRKAGPLTVEEWEEVKQHPVVGERICQCLALGKQVAPIIRHHHERWDGGGYVDGLGGERIPLYARIVSVVDAFDAMSSDRPYRKALPPARVLHELRSGAGSQWDPEIVATLLDLIDEGAIERPAASRRTSRAWRAA